MSKRQSVLLILALSVAVMYANIGGLDIYALDEAKNAEAAREMFESGDYITPYFNYELRTDKPPLHYYFMAAGYQIFGENAFGARFFSSLAGVVTIMLVFLFGHKHFGQRVATFSALVLISSLHTAFQFHMSVPDPYLILFMTWGFLSFYNAYISNNKWHLLAFYFAIGCGLLTKGPIALGLAGLTALLFLILNKDFKWSTIVRMQPFTGVILSLGLAFPWYYMVHMRTGGEWTDGFFFKHNFNRFSSAMEGHDGIFLLTFAYVILLGMLAYLPFVFQSVKSAWKDRKDQSASLFLLTGVTVIVVFFAISSTKLPNYTTPAYPLLALLIGNYVSKLDPNWFKNRWNKFGVWCYAIILIAFPVGIYFGVQADSSLSHLSHLAWYFLPLMACGIYVLFTMLKTKAIEKMLFVNNASWIVMTVLFFHLAFPYVDAENPVRKTLPQIDTSEKIIGFKRINSAYVFALKKEIPRFDEVTLLEEYIKNHDKGYLISRTEHLKELESIGDLKFVAKARDTFENPTTLVMRWGY